VTAYFIFDDDKRLVSERIYFDTLTLLKQLVGGLDMKNPANWFLGARCLRGLLKMSGGEPDPRLLDTVPPVFDRPSQ
jgi:hypothetical protein